MFKIIIIAVIITIVGLFVMTKIDPANSGSQYIITDTAYNYSAEDAVKVEITGEIIHPGDYEISPQASLSDLISLAGGLTSNADPKSYTPGLVIGSRTSFYIPKKAEIPEVCEVKDTEKTNINEAGETELKDVGFTSSQATSLVNYRSANGPFEAIEDIMNVSGIGEKTYLTVRDRICLE